LGERASDLFFSFKTWCELEGISEVTPNNQTAFSNALGRRGIEKHKLKDGMHYGLQLTGDLTGDLQGVMGDVFDGFS